MYSLLKALSWVLSSLSERATLRFVAFLTILTYDVLRLRRGTIIRNLKIAFPERSTAELTRVGRESIRNFILTAMEFFRSPKVDIAGNIAVSGREHIDAALAQGKGVYILCFHMGNWEAMCAKINREIGPAFVLVKKVGGPSVNRFVEEVRDHIGFRSVRRERKGDGYRRIREILARGEMVGFAFDQARPGEPRLPFFGVPAKTNTSLAAIWQRVPAPIVPSWIERDRLGYHTLRFFPELKLEASADPKKDITEHSILFNEVVAAHVRQRPDQYLWMHNRWKQ